MARRDRLVVRTLRCGRSNPGSNPGPGISSFLLFLNVDVFFFLFSSFVFLLYNAREQTITKEIHFTLKLAIVRFRTPRGHAFCITGDDIFDRQIIVSLFWGTGEKRNFSSITHFELTLCPSIEFRYTIKINK